MEETKVVLVDVFDAEVGVAGKLDAHKVGLLHRALSVFVINSKGEWLLQRRAKEKYHSGGLWSNTCCSHPFHGENITEAARRRLKEEMGLDCHLDEVFSFIYREPVGNNLVEHEFDHVLVGISDDQPNPDPSEVMDLKYVGFEELSEDIAAHPEKYSIWFRKSFERVNNALKQKIES